MYVFGYGNESVRRHVLRNRINEIGSFRVHPQVIRCNKNKLNKCKTGQMHSTIQIFILILFLSVRNEPNRINAITNDAYCGFVCAE